MPLYPTLAALIGTALVVVIYRRSTARAAKAKAQWLAGKKLVDATVTDSRELEKSEDVAYWSTIEYVVDGRRYAITGDYGFDAGAVGRTVSVAYDPALPSEARLMETPAEASAAGGVLSLVIVFAAFFILAMLVASLFTR